MILATFVSFALGLDDLSEHERSLEGLLLFVNRGLVVVEQDLHMCQPERPFSGQEYDQKVSGDLLLSLLVSVTDVRVA